MGIGRCHDNSPTADDCSAASALLNAWFMQSRRLVALAFSFNTYGLVLSFFPCRRNQHRFGKKEKNKNNFFHVTLFTDTIWFQVAASKATQF